MKNYQISSGQIPHLVRLTADLFREMNNEINIGPQAKTNQMHFVADLLKDLVDTAYPIEDKGIDARNLIEVAQFQSLEEMIDAVAKIVKATKPPKAGEF